MPKLLVLTAQRMEAVEQIDRSRLNQDIPPERARGDDLPPIDAQSPNHPRLVLLVRKVPTENEIQDSDAGLDPRKGTRRIHSRGETPRGLQSSELVE
jgi:hypothetical protein